MGGRMGRTLKRDTLADGKWVSTVELDYSNPIIALRDVAVDFMASMGGPEDGSRLPPTGGRFETMVFPSKGNWTDIDVSQYATEEEALAGHEAMVAKWAARVAEETKAREEGRS